MTERGSRVRPMLACTLLALFWSACARGAGSPAAPPRGGLPAALPALQADVGLIAAVAGDSVVRVDWRSPPAGYGVHLFHARERTRVYDNAPLLQFPTANHAVLTRLKNGVDHFFGLAIEALPVPEARAANPPSGLIPVGLVLRVRPGPVLYVDAGAPVAGADGQTPATAFPDLPTALLATRTGGRNIWIRGSQSLSSSTLSDGDSLFGGFQGSYGDPFTVTDRRPQAAPTRLVGAAEQTLLSTSPGSTGILLDGVLLDGQQQTFVGLSAEDSSVSLRAVEATGFRTSAVLVTNGSGRVEQRITFAGSNVHDNGTEGLSASGALDVYLHGSRFDNNGQEGVELDDLIALEGMTATLTATGCSFHGNGGDGLDADLAAPSSPGALSGRFRIDIVGCTFSRNAVTGLLLDAEYELAPLWSAQTQVRHCVFRGNQGPGMHVDNDGLATTVIHGCLSSANGADGVRITSEELAGITILSASVLSGNLGAGARATAGQNAILATHCIFAGNAAGGLLSETVESGANSCMAHLQANPFLGTRVTATANLPTQVTGVFNHAPVGFNRVIAVEGPQWTLAPGPVPALGNTLEVLDDGRPQELTESNGQTIQLESPVPPLVTPAAIRWFQTPGVAEDYRLAPLSPGLGAGMSLVGAPSVDAGIFGAPNPAPAGLALLAGTPPFTLTQTSPSPSQGIGSSETLVLAFSQELDAASLTGRILAVPASGANLEISLVGIGDQVLVFPPPAGWGSEALSIQVHRGIRGTDGATLATPLSIPIHTN